MNNINLVDCTLRDGGHLNDSRFGKDTIENVVKGLVESNVEYIELGFLTTRKYDPEYSLFGSIEDARKVIPKESKNTKYALMAYRYDVSDLEEYDGTVDLIRTTFHVYDFDEGIENCKKIIKKGYNCSVNLINFWGAYSTAEKIEALRRINDIHPTAISLADTYGLMDIKEMEFLYELVEYNLDKEIVIGIHMHENKGISYGLAQKFLEIKHGDRKAIIDASAYGMGEVPGNLRLELIMDYMNKYYGGKYDLVPVYNLIDKYIKPLKQNINWDYDLPYAISSKYGINRKYAKFLIDKSDVSWVQMKTLMAPIHGRDISSYNESRIEELYNQLQNGENLS